MVVSVEEVQVEEEVEEEDGEDERGGGLEEKRVKYAVTDNKEVSSLRLHVCVDAFALIRSLTRHVIAPSPPFSFSLCVGVGALRKAQALKRYVLEAQRGERENNGKQRRTAENSTKTPSGVSCFANPLVLPTERVPLVSKGLLRQASSTSIAVLAPCF